LTCNAATYRFRDRAYSLSNGQHLGPKFRNWGIPWGNRTKRGEELSGTDMYHHAKFHADPCHRRRDCEISVSGQTIKLLRILCSK